MNMNDLQLIHRSGRKRVGRGISAGGGKTAGRGTKGQNSRSGGQRSPGFEGGQTPLYQRLPKLKGFTSHRAKSQIIHTSDLQHLPAGKTLSIEDFFAAGFINDVRVNAKLLFDTDPTKGYKVALPFASTQAVKAVERAGGTFTATPLKPLAKSSQTKETLSRANKT